MIDIAAGKLIGKGFGSVRFIDTAGVGFVANPQSCRRLRGIAPDGRDHEQLPELIMDWNGAHILTLTHSTS